MYYMTNRIILCWIMFFLISCGSKVDVRSHSRDDVNLIITGYSEGVVSASIHNDSSVGVDILAEGSSYFDSSVKIVFANTSGVSELWQSGYGAYTKNAKSFRRLLPGEEMRISFDLSELGWKHEDNAIGEAKWITVIIYPLHQEAGPFYNVEDLPKFNPLRKSLCNVIELVKEQSAREDR